jgi:hypothetical protein
VIATISIAAMVTILSLVGALLYHVAKRIDAERQSHRDTLTTNERTRERDEARANHAVVTTQLAATEKVLESTASDLAVALEELRDAKSRELVGASDADLNMVVVGMLEKRQAEMRAAADRRRSEAGAVPAPKPTEGTAPPRVDRGD